MDKNDRKYSGKDVSLLCKPWEYIHTSVCQMKLPEFFNPVKRPRVNKQPRHLHRFIVAAHPE